MSGLDFSALTDDQLLELLREACRAAAARNPAVARAAEAIVLDEAERARIAAAASDHEVAALRAAERERIAKEARDKVRAEAERRDAAARASLNAEKGREAAEAERRRAERDKSWLARAAALVDSDPQSLSLIYTHTKFGTRVLINNGFDRFAREHLADYETAKGAVRTGRALVKRKPEIAALCAEFAAAFNLGFSLRGCDFDWSAS